MHYYFPFHATALSFNFTNIDDQGIEVTPNDDMVRSSAAAGKAGRATYKKPFYLWDEASGNITDFNTYFVFVITQYGKNVAPADGLTFFLLPYDNATSNITTGAAMGLPANQFTGKMISPFVAVEFDTFWNDQCDPTGINWETHVATPKVPLVFVVDLKKHLPSKVAIGFSASTGSNFERNNVKSWTFNLTLQIDEPTQPSPSPSSNTVTPSPGKKIGTGPKKFSYGELFRATNYFADEQKLREGGFGGVFKGFLRELDSYVFVKRISNGSKQGIKEDVKSSNVMLDSNFNAKLGDFGLARLVDHGKDSQTTILAGTRGYTAPKCVITGKANKESNVYSFGVVALEIACRRKLIDLDVPESQMRMMEWVWDLYGTNRLLEDALDPKICPNFVKEEMECLMIVGLWCAHPDHNLRPSIRQAIHVLNFEATLPILPAKMPVPTYLAPPVNASSLVYGSTTISNSNQFQSSTYSYNTNCSKFTSSSATSSPSASLLYT
ncbi:hypothetical protein ACSBR1_022455 [Camellia fascicularis]